MNSYHVTKLKNHDGPFLKKGGVAESLYLAWSISRIKEYGCLKNVIHHQIDSKFYDKIWVGFCCNTGKRIFLEVSF